MSDKEKTKFVTLSRREVASKIFPDYDSRKAVSALTRWIQQDPILLSRLLKRGYRKRMGNVPTKGVGELPICFLWPRSASLSKNFAKFAS